MYQDIYRSLDKFSAAVGKSSVCLKIKETVGEFRRQATSKKKKVERRSKFVTGLFHLGHQTVKVKIESQRPIIT